MLRQSKWFFKETLRGVAFKRRHFTVLVIAFCILILSWSIFIKTHHFTADEIRMIKNERLQVRLQAREKRALMTPIKKQQVVQQLIAENNFIGLFERADEISDSADRPYLINEAATTYIEACCNYKAAVLALLEKNHFNISGNMVDAYKHAAADEVRRTGADEVYSAERRVNRFSLNFIAYRSYEVIVFLRKGSIKKVVAKVTSNNL